MSLYNNLTIEDLITLARSVDSGNVMLSNCKTRAVIKGEVPAGLLGSKLALKTSCTHRCDVVVEWLS